MHVLIRNRRWRLEFTSKLPRDKRCGDCDPPSVADKTIRIRRSLKGKLKLDTLLHEMIHAAFPDLTEEAVEAGATDIAAVLYDQLGYREHGNGAD